MDKKTAIVPGSFDPMTLGHVEIIKKALKLYDKVYVAVMINSEKTYMFTNEERVEIAKLSLGEFKNVEVIFDDGMLYELANKLSADAIVKGVRNEKDLKYENEMAEFNKEKAPNVKTVFVTPGKKYSEISSTLVRERLNNFEEIYDLVSSKAIDYIIEKKLSKKF